MPIIEESDQIAKDETQYYDMLYNFSKVIVKANDMALNGDSMEKIAKKLQRLAPAYLLLCKTDTVKAGKKPERKPKRDISPESEPLKEQPEQLPSNFMNEENGWGLCPVCRKKMIKVTSTTRLIDFPAYCKPCKAEYIVSWWNVDNKDIAYQRYVNDKHYIDRRNIRNEGIKGNGVKHFMRTRTSSTERVALEL